MQRREYLLSLRKENQIGKINDSDDLIKETLQTSKIIAMVGASVPKENEAVAPK